MHRLRWGTFALVVVGVMAVGGAIVLSLDRTHVEHEGEWVEALLQTGLIAVLGVVTTGVLETFKDSLQRSRDISRARHEAISDISRIYMDMKLVRRRVQCNGHFTLSDIAKINARQVRLELHRFSSPSLFGENKVVDDALHAMEDYLNKVANKPESPESQGFSSKEGFRGFSLKFYKVRVAMWDVVIAGQTHFG